MTQEKDAPPRRFLRPAAVLPMAYACLVILTAPYIGTLRDLLERTFPENYVAILKVTVVTGTVAFIALAVRLLLTHTLRRLLGLFIMAILVGLQLWLTNTPYAQINWIERLHFFEYALMSVLFWWALKARFPGFAASVLAFLSTARVGVVDEFVQWLVPSRVGDIRDIELNLVSGLLGQLFVLLVLLPGGGRVRFSRKGTPAMLVSTAALVLSVGLFFGVVHTGHVIKDPTIGEFRSRYTRGELEARVKLRVAPLSVEKAKKAINSKRNFRIRDFYLSEGVTHINARNNHVIKKAMVLAAKEQAIIEGYYPAILLVKEDKTTVESVLTRAGLPPELPSRYYRSDQFSDVLYTRSRLCFAVPTILLTLLCLVAAYRLKKQTVT